MSTDPARALTDFQLALQRIDELPKPEQGNLTIDRLRAYILRKEANGYTELGEYAAATPLFAQAAAINRRFAAADPQDARSLNDVEVDFDDQALAHEEAALPELGASPESRRAARNVVTRATSV